MERCPVCGVEAGLKNTEQRSNKKLWIAAAIASAIILALAISLIILDPGGIARQSILSSAAKTPEPLRGLFYVRNGILRHTSIDSISPREIVQYDLPPQWRTVFAIQESEDGRRFFYPKDIDNTKPNYCADIYCYDLTSENPEEFKIGSDINNYTINQDGSKVFYLVDKALYVSNLTGSDEIAANVCRFFIDKKGARLIYETFDGRLVLYAGKNKAKAIGSGFVLQYVSSDLNTVYYMKDGSLYLLKDGKDVRRLDSGVVSISNLYADGSFYYLKKNPANTLNSLYYYSDGRSAKISENCDNTWGDEAHRVQQVLDSKASYCGSDRPLLVYSQPAAGTAVTANGTGPAELYVCSGSKVLGKIGDEKPELLKYDAGNNKIYYGVNHNEDPFLYDLYCVTTAGEKASEAVKLAEDADFFGILPGGDVVYLKSESDSPGKDLYVNSEKIDSLSEILEPLKNGTASFASFAYADNISRADHTFTLKLYQDGKVAELADDVTFYSCSYYNNSVAYLVRKGKRATTGGLFLYDGAKAGQPVDTEVNAIIPPMENQYYSYWDDQPTHDIE